MVLLQLIYCFSSRYKTTNGIQAQEDGISYPGNVPESGNYVRSGSYSYEWEGVTYTVTWTADENGFHPEGDHLPDFSHTREHVGPEPDYPDFDDTAGELRKSHKVRGDFSLY